MIAWRKCECGKTAAPRRRVCWRCHHARYAERHPRRVLYWNLHNSARNRAIAFKISYEEFCLFCDLTSYDLFVGNSGDALTVDRIDPRKGYFLENMRVKTHTENSSENNAKKRLQTLRMYEHTFRA